jgi:2-succinyl-5-enolpyruvyl-6-hydroxy-3-cyclohexene-1-carboxylate synthase
MIYPKIPLAQSIIQICEAKGIHTIIISGSRNAPLTIGFRNPTFTSYSIADERSAAFFFGIAQQTKKPVAFCTSGSALLNYYPAFAFYSQIPMIVISADRDLKVKLILVTDKYSSSRAV